MNGNRFFVREKTVEGKRGSRAGTVAA